uniref:Protein turtle homolog A-like n=1 Tax=Hirondellea gigas TaxID=1518452 RepID=A0A6A7G0P9_9CRUS
MANRSHWAAVVMSQCICCLLAFLLLLSTRLPSARISAAAADLVSIDGLENSPLTKVQAVVGESVLLPCNVSPLNPADSPILVLFFYETKGTPIYSVDARGSSLYTGEHWSDVEQLGSRASLKVRPGRQGLLLTKLTNEDAGLYRCRVDFKSSPTRNLRIRLEIIIPPRHILVTSSWDEGRIVSGMIGPYPEGADVTLVCQVTGGNPTPKVTWWQAGSLMDDLVEMTTKQVTRNSLRLPRLTRDDLLRKLTCIASNSNLTAPLSTAVTIDIAFPPNSVRISAKTFTRNTSINRGSNAVEVIDRELSASDDIMNVVKVRVNREEYLTCEATGSRPPAKLIWKRNGRVIDTGVFTSPAPSEPYSSVGFAGSSALSTLQILPTLDDHRAVISCMAYSPKLPNEPLEDEVTLNVLYQPQLSLSFKSKIAQSNLEEGDNFSFECQVTANPPAGQVQWAKDGVPIQANTSEGIRLTGSHLQIQKSSRSMSGEYTCAAANSEGVATSDYIAVRIKFAPVCSSRIQRQYGAGKKEEISITCWVDSHPAPLTFRWAFNSSNELVDMPQNTFSSHGMSSTLNYLPHTELDFGSLLCWAANDVGLMKEPCVINVVPAAKPEPVRMCEVVNNSSMLRSVALVSCTPGWDGGLDQTFTLEVREAKHKHSRILASVQHSPTPLFNMKGLKYEEEYLFIITSVNSRGTSPPVNLSYMTPSGNNSMMSSNARTSENTSWLSWTLFVAVILGVLITILACLFAIVGLMKFKTNANKTTAKIVYAGPLRECEENEKSNALSSPTMIYCDKHDCEVEQLMKNSYARAATTSDCGESLPKLQIEELNSKEEQFRSSGSDIRIATPYAWNPDSGSTCEDTYFRNSGPYHINSLSPPSPPRLPTPCNTTTINHVHPHQHPKHKHHHHHHTPYTAAPLASSDSLGRSSSSSTSRPTSSNSRTSSSTSRPSSCNYSTSEFSMSTVALHPDYLSRDDSANSSKTPLMSDVSRESAV